jgi:hypothetical protein
MDIRNFLDYFHITTSEIYATTDGNSIQTELKTAASVLVLMEKPIWEDNPDIITFIDSFRTKNQ